MVDRFTASPDPNALLLTIRETDPIGVGFIKLLSHPTFFGSVVNSYQMLTSKLDEREV
jgi:hypothetical protein